MSVEPPSYANLTVDPEIEHIAPDVFAFTGVIRDPIFGVPHRMTVIRLTNTDDLVVYSPFDPSLVDLSSLGRVKAIIAPSRIHYMFAHRFKAAHPNATLYTSAALRDRFPDKEWGVILDKDTPPDIISPEVQIKCITNCTYLKEVLAVHVPSGTMLCADLAFNLTPKLLERAPWGGRIFYILASPSNPLDIHALVRSWVRPDCKGIVPQLKEVLDWDWDRVVPCHGEIMESGGKQAFREGTFRFVSDTADGKVNAVVQQQKFLLIAIVGLVLAGGLSLAWKKI